MAHSGYLISRQLLVRKRIIAEPAAPKVDAKVLKSTKPAGLPFLLPTRFELVSASKRQKRSA